MEIDTTIHMKSSQAFSCLFYLWYDLIIKILLDSLIVNFYFQTKDTNFQSLQKLQINKCRLTTKAVKVGWLKITH